MPAAVNIGSSGGPYGIGLSQVTYDEKASVISEYVCVYGFSPYKPNSRPKPRYSRMSLEFAGRRVHAARVSRTTAGMSDRAVTSPRFHVARLHP